MHVFSGVDMKLKIEQRHVLLAAFFALCLLLTNCSTDNYNVSAPTAKMQSAPNTGVVPNPPSDGGSPNGPDVGVLPVSGQIPGTDSGGDSRLPASSPTPAPTAAPAAATATPKPATPTPSPTAMPTATPPPTVNNTVCDPFSTGSKSPGKGLIGEGIKYLTSSQSSIRPQKFSDLWSTALGSKAVNLLFNDVNVQSTYFSAGFTLADGSKLKDSDGKTLTANFGFKLKSNLVLGNLQPGYYQIAVIADDGAILKIQNGVKNSDGSRSELVVDNDGVHAMKMSCSSKLLHIDASSRFPLTFDFYQGPPYHLGLIILARPVPANNAQDPECGKSGSSYFFENKDAVTPVIVKQPYKDLLNRGWKPIENANYELPSTAADSICPN